MYMISPINPALRTWRERVNHRNDPASKTKPRVKLQSFCLILMPYTNKTQIWWDRLVYLILLSTLKQEETNVNFGLLYKKVKNKFSMLNVFSLLKCRLFSLLYNSISLLISLPPSDFLRIVTIDSLRPDADNIFIWYMFYCYMFFKVQLDIKYFDRPTVVSLLSVYAPWN